MFLGANPTGGWSEEDRDWALALQLLERESCRGCGHPLDESHDPTHEFDWVVEESRCHACAAAQRHMEARASDSNASTAGLVVGTRLRGRARG